MTEVGLSQLVKRLPAAFPTGTRREAIPPIAQPSANGVRIDEIENTVSTARCSRGEAASDRMAYAPPRRTIPIPAMNSGTSRVDAIEPNAAG